MGERIRCCDLVRLLPWRFRLLLRPSSNRLRTGWYRKRIGLRFALADAAEINSRADTDSNSAAAVAVTVTMFFLCLMELRLASARFGFSGLRFGGRNFGGCGFGGCARAWRVLGLLLWRIRGSLRKRVSVENENASGNGN